MVIRPKSPNRRDLDRVPLEMFLNAYVDEKQHRAVTTNVSPTGFFLNRLLGRRSQLVTRDSRFVQLEFQLPGTSETVWARGEVRHDELELPLGPRQDGSLLHGSGVRLVALPRAHAQLLRDFVVERKRRRVAEILDLIRGNRYH